MLEVVELEGPGDSVVGVRTVSTISISRLADVRTVSGCVPGLPRTDANYLRS